MCSEYGVTHCIVWMTLLLLKIGFIHSYYAMCVWPHILITFLDISSSLYHIPNIVIIRFYVDLCCSSGIWALRKNWSATFPGIKGITLNISKLISPKQILTNILEKLKYIKMITQNISKLISENKQLSHSTSICNTDVSNFLKLNCSIISSIGSDVRHICLQRIFGQN